MNLVLPTLKARERLEALEEIHAGNIAAIHFTAYGNLELALQAESRMMMQESKDSHFKTKL